MKQIKAHNVGFLAENWNIKKLNENDPYWDESPTAKADRLDYQDGVNQPKGAPKLKPFVTLKSYPASKNGARQLDIEELQDGNPTKNPKWDGRWFKFGPDGNLTGQASEKTLAAYLDRYVSKEVYDQIVKDFGLKAHPDQYGAMERNHQRMS